jgi:hypothetical protein
MRISMRVNPAWLVRFAFITAPHHDFFVAFLSLRGVKKLEILDSSSSNMNQGEETNGPIAKATKVRARALITEAKSLKSPSTLPA